MPPRHNVKPDRVPGEPVDLPAHEYREDGPPAKTIVHTELGIPISFSTRTGEFHAHVSRVTGRGSAAELHSKDFHELLRRVRQRALIVPVRAYRLQVAGTGTSPRLEIEEVAVVEYHARRDRPFIAVPAGEEHKPTNKVMQLSSAYLPTMEHIEKLRDVVQWMREEEERHADKVAALRVQREAVFAAIPQLAESDVRRIQETGAQAADAGLAVFDVEDEEDESA